MRARGPNHGGRDRVIGAIADGQHGVVSHWQLLEAGLSPAAIGRCLDAGRLRRLFLGVYAVGHVALKREGWWMAALLACGPESAISHEDAAVALGIGRGPTFPIHVTTRTDRGRRQQRLVTHRQRLEASEVFEVDGLRVTTGPRTILDQAAHLDPRALRALVERAQDRQLFKARPMAAILERHPRRKGTRPLKNLIQLMDPDADNARSHLERLFLSAIRSSRLPRPEVNYLIAGKRRDFVWPEQRLAVEVDGYAYHSSREAMRRDRKRDRELLAHGWRPARFTYEDVAFEPSETALETMRLLRP